MSKEQRDTIYLNHAGTSWPKPPTVLQACNRFQQSGPTDWPQIFNKAFQTVADFYHIDRSRLLLTPSCTAAINLALTDHEWQAGDRILTSHFEHHALGRTLTKLNSLGVTTTKIQPGSDELIDLAHLETELKKSDVKLVAMTAACNVTGLLLPMVETIELAHQNNAMVLIDGAQVAGWWDLDLRELGVDMFTIAGHKGPQAPWGIGGLYVAPRTQMHCASAVCELPTASESNTETPSQFEMPGYCDAGSVNIAALAGMAAGCEFLSSSENATRLEKARDLTGRFTEQARQIENVTIFHDVPLDKKMPSVALGIDNMSSTDVAKQLRDAGIITSAGLQCSPDSHNALGTGKHGLTRFSFSSQNAIDEVTTVLSRVQKIATNA